MKDYRDYRIKDFIQDERFREWVYIQSEDHFWKDFLANYPGKREEVQLAKQLLLGMQLDKSIMTPSEEEELRINIHHTINAGGGKYNKSTPWLKWAASVTAILLVALASLWVYQYSLKQVYSTGYREIKNINLPDGSTVVLNANSKLSWHETEEARKVVIEGEALFKVKKKDNRQKFIVLTNEVAVEVLGTIFNVNSRRRKTKVVLSEGAVSLQHRSSGKQALMQPGDLVIANQLNSQFTYQQVNTELFTSWIDNKVVINNTSLREIAVLLEDIYGFNVVIKNETLENKKFTATTSVPLDEPETLLKLIAMTFDVEVARKGYKIQIEPKKNRQKKN